MTNDASSVRRPSKEEIAELLQPLAEWADTDDFSRAVIRELRACLENNAYRASHVLAFQLLMYSLYRKVEEYGLSTFVRKAKDHGIEIEGKVRTIWDLNKTEDSQLIFLCHEIGLYDQNVRRQLESQLETRNGYAHVSQLKPLWNGTKAFVESAATYCDLIRQSSFKGSKLGPLDEILTASEMEVKQKASEMATQSIILILKEVMDEAELVTTNDGAARMKNAVTFIQEALSSRHNVDEAKGLFDILHRGYFSGILDTPIKRALQPILLDAIRRTEIKKFAIDQDYVKQYVDEFCLSTTFEDAGKNAELVSEFKGRLSASDLTKICNAICKNLQISNSYRARPYLLRILKARRADIKSSLLGKIGRALEEQL